MVTTLNNVSSGEVNSQILRALIVDDDRVARGVATFALQCAGFHCEAACDGEEAAAKLAATPFDAVVTDLRMPGQHGYHLIQEVLISPRKPVLTVLTSLDEPRLTRDLLARGVDAVYIKPRGYATLAADIGRRVAERRQRLTNPQDQPIPEQQHTLPSAASLTAAPAAVLVDDSQTTVDELQFADDESQSDTDSAPPAPAHRQAQTQAESIVAVLLKDLELSRSLGRQLGTEGIKVVAVANSDELYAQLNRERVDLIIIEHQFGGFLTGLEMLERLAREQIRPELMLLATEGGDLLSRASLIGVDTILPPGCSLDMLAMSTKRILQNASSTSIFIPREARTLVQKFDEIASMPQLLIKLMRYMEMPLQEIPLKQLANDISVDPKATTELLKLTNSASVGLSRENTSVFAAINLLGPKRAIALIFASATIAMQSKLTKNWSQDTQRWYSQRGVLIANVAAVIAENMESVSGETAFVLGLLQDIGVLILANSFPHRYGMILQRFRENGRADLTSLEREDFNIEHAQVSAALLQKWELPASLIELVLAHHNENLQIDRSKTQMSFLRSIRIGEALANVKDVPHQVRGKRLNDLLAHYGPTRKSMLNELFSNAIAQTASSCELFNLPVPDASSYTQLLAAISQHSTREN